jgi:hypothetical protein
VWSSAAGATIFPFRRVEVANESAGRLDGSQSETLKPDAIGRCEVPAVLSVVKAVVGFHQRTARDAEKPREFAIGEPPEAFGDVPSD